MSRPMLPMIAEGVTITSVVIAFLASTAAIVHPAPIPTSTTAQTSARSLQGVQPQRLNQQTLQEFFSVGGGEIQTQRTSTPTRFQNQQGIELFFPATPSRTFYPGTISPLPNELLRGDQFPNAIKLFEAKI